MRKKFAFHLAARCFEIVLLAQVIAEEEYTTTPEFERKIPGDVLTLAILTLFYLSR
jgi:hypothetical protein